MLSIVCFKSSNKLYCMALVLMFKSQRKKKTSHLLSPACACMILYALVMFSLNCLFYQALSHKWGLQSWHVVILFLVPFLMFFCFIFHSCHTTYFTVILWPQDLCHSYLQCSDHIKFYIMKACMPQYVLPHSYLNWNTFVTWLIIDPI